MPRRTFAEESLSLYYAKTLVEGLILLDRISDKHHLTEEEEEIIDRNIDFLSKALSGHDLISGSENKLAPDAESIEILNYLSSALILPKISDEKFNEILRTKILSSLDYLTNLKANKLSDKERIELRSFMEAITTRLIRESTVPHYEDDDDLFSFS